MKATTKLLLSAAVGIATTFSVRANMLFFDFGDSTLMTSGNWNNLVHTNATLTPGPPIANAIDSLGNFTGISLSANGFNTGDNTAGTTTPGGAAAIFASTATQDSLFGHTVVFNGQGPLPLATLSLGGLDGSGNTLYSFTFFASRTGVSDDRETQYQVVGSTSGYSLLDAANNTSNVAIVSGIVPNPDGSLLVNISPGPNNNNSSGFFYLGAMEITISEVPEPSSLALAALGGLAAVVWGRRLRGNRS
jgi:hypothetical protein